ncbi:MAG: S8 family serine peptidase [Bacteroidetes bacterium]|nr:S8 family serine peptidase [Bacteroidota bacterium]MCL2302682.1 S8 family serine peptidase [Lentimicrobiaceae bacterium]
MKKITSISIFLLLTALLFAQSPGKYWVQFNIRDAGNYTIDRPEAFLSSIAIEKRNKFNIPITENDIPVSRKFIETVKKMDTTAVLLTTSKWLNGATFYSENPDFIALIKGNEFVAYVEQTHIGSEPEIFTQENTSFFNAAIPVVDIPNDLDYGLGTRQIRINNAHWLHRLGYKGEGVSLQLHDGGFLYADTIRHFRQHFADNRVRGVKNIVQPSISTFRDGDHGTGVWSCIAAYIPGELVGSAPACNFYLVQTEDNRTEYVVEEDNWVAALELADSLGVDVVSSSLGYTTFDDTTYYRGYSSLDGKTSRASLAADIAVSKGMIVVNSAGNSGNKKWFYIGAPAEATHILAVGATDSLGNKAPFSSFGPTYDGRIKPDGAAVGWHTYVGLKTDKTIRGNGTSYSAPLFAGMVACLRQAFPYKTSFEIIDAVRKSGMQYATPDSALGYGITDFLKAYNLLLEPENKKLNLNFDTFVITDKEFPFTIETKGNAKVTITHGLRSDGKMKSKDFNLKAGENKITLTVAALPEGKKYDFIDLRISDGKTEYQYVLGRE